MVTSSISAAGAPERFAAAREMPPEWYYVPARASPLPRLPIEPEGLAGQNGPMASASRETVLTTCPRDCYDACGIAVVKRNGAVHQVRGDPGHPVSRGKLCPKCSTGYNGVWRDPETRLTRPLRRVGPKGEGRFEPVSWDEALAAIAQRLGEIAETTGP